MQAITLKHTLGQAEHLVYIHRLVPAHYLVPMLDLAGRVRRQNSSYSLILVGGNDTQEFLAIPVQIYIYLNGSASSFVRTCRDYALACFHQSHPGSRYGYATG